MIEKRTIVDQIEIIRSGHVQIRFGLLLVEDGREIACEWHRTAVEPGGDVDAQIAAVNAHLAQMDRMPCGVAETARVKAIAQAVHTPDAIKKFRDERTARQAVGNL